MHAGDGKKGEGQRAKGDKISVGKGRWAKRSDSREKMHAGDGRKGVGRRAQGGKNLGGRGEMGKAE